LASNVARAELFKLWIYDRAVPERDSLSFLGDMQVLGDVTIALPAGDAGKYFMLA
jgi:hypothetical protein